MCEYEWGWGVAVDSVVTPRHPWRDRPRNGRPLGEILGDNRRILRAQTALLGALDIAASNDDRWRRAPPRGHLEYMGVAHADRGADVRREEFERTAQELLSKVLLTASGSVLASSFRTTYLQATLVPHVQVVSSVPIDAAVDNFAATRFIHERLPPALPPPDMARRPPPSEATSLTLGSRVRLVTRHAARLAVEGDAAILYYSSGNTRIYMELPEPNHMDFDLEAREHMNERTNE